jgi:hypothetical protein
MSKEALNVALRRNNKLVKQLLSSVSTRAGYLEALIERDQRRRDEARADQAKFFEDIKTTVWSVLPKLVESLPGFASGLSVSASQGSPGDASAPQGSASAFPYVPAPAAPPPAGHVYVQTVVLQSILDENHRMRAELEKQNNGGGVSPIRPGVRVPPATSAPEGPPRA